MSYTPLQVISSYSLLQSNISIKKLVLDAKEKGYRSLALTDKNVMYGAIEFYDECLKNDVKPIIGLTIELMGMEIFDQSFELILLAKNFEGYKNLMKISSLKMTENRNNLDAKLTLNDIKSYLNNLFIVIPKNSEIFSLLMRGQKNLAIDYIHKLKLNMDKQSLYFGLDINTSDNLIQIISNLSKNTQTSTVALSPVKYLNANDYFAVDVLNSIDSGQKIVDPLESSHILGSAWLRNCDEMYKLFDKQGLNSALVSNDYISKACNLKIVKQQPQLPKFKNDLHLSSAQFLQKLCEDGLRSRIKQGEIDKNIVLKYKQRLTQELTVINRMGFNDYFLIVWDVINYLHQHNIMTGPGRGSAAGSLVSYALKITDVDPIRYGLLFERFLNEERAQMPDIDLDIPDDKRNEILNYVHNKYGDDYVSQIVTFGTLSAKQVVRDVGRVFGLNSMQMSKWSDAIPTQLNIKLSEAIKQSKKLSNLVSDNRINQLIFDVSLKLEGIPRHYSTHAAGVIISANKLINNAPVQMGNEGLLMTQYSKNYVEQVGLLKMDFLGLRNLSLIAHIVDTIYKLTGKYLKVNQINLNDIDTINCFQKGQTNGVFQFESSGIKNVLRKLKPNSFELIAAVDALYRPGPMHNIDNFIKRKNDNYQINSDTQLKKILQPTFGIIVYQEQVMQLASAMAGFTLGEADILRRAMSKKKQSVMDNIHDKFVNGALSKGFSIDTAEKTFSYIDQFASYGFNKSHAYAYSKMAFQLAYLKVHYPLAFYTNIFNSVLNNAVKTKIYFNEAKARNVKIAGPNINLSEEMFTIKNNNLVFGFRSIKGLRTDFIRFIISERSDNGKYTNLENFIRRIDKKFRKPELLELLVYSGALNDFGYNHAELLNAIPEFISSINLSGNSITLFNNLKPKVRHFNEISLSNKLNKELEILGVYLSGHPVEQYLYLRRQYKLTFSDEFPAVDSYVNTLFFINNIKVIRTKKGQEMAFLNGSDMSSSYSVVVFPNAFLKCKSYLKTSKVILINGKVDVDSKNNGSKQLIARTINLAINYPKPEKHSTKKLYLKIDNQHDSKETWRKLYFIIQNNLGKIPIIIHRDSDDSTRILREPYQINGTNSAIDSLKLILGKDNAIYK
ncbi:DNA polymerase III subunit alpha [Apilactobacillus sp. M161]|uniref:DNA polymerase III subunit alpha n=1 Tax=Apilactobacillus xinyiensis TaxID=2841032 RepID=A0ABT0I0C0_9LACO|nr:DNA polymerase III subunit alpha [Apilactobacillus xinyiensis]MCK8624074.1 DNA polymerase III subunit alpha [Apilactobacillus xinyiensis]